MFGIHGPHKDSIWALLGGDTKLLVSVLLSGGRWLLFSILWAGWLISSFFLKILKSLTKTLNPFS